MRLLVGLLITVLGGLGVLWQVDQAASDSAPGQTVVLHCPLGGHGQVPATWSP